VTVTDSGALMVAGVIAGELGTGGAELAAAPAVPDASLVKPSSTQGD
jgi:hypothetical protein